MGAHALRVVQPQLLWLQLRLGMAESSTFPRVLGIEAAGMSDDPDGASFARGQKVVTMMGRMARSTRGYAEVVVVPATQVIPIDTELRWETAAYFLRCSRRRPTDPRPCAGIPVRTIMDSRSRGSYA